MEIWKDIIGYEGLYQVSNFGRVKSLNYNKTEREEIMKAGNNGHLHVVLHKNGKEKTFLIHQLVANAFLPNPDNKPIVHHIDHNPLNNNVDNLVWLTYEEHAAKHPEWGKAAAKVLSKPINQYDLDGNFIKTWYSSYDIQRELGYNHSNITRCCKGGFFSEQRNKWVNVTQAYGYKWEYADEC